MVISFVESEQTGKWGIAIWKSELKRNQEFCLGGILSLRHLFHLQVKTECRGEISP